MIKKVISGGQTGADIAGLVAAYNNGITTGGAAPGGYRTEVGPQFILKDKYNLYELPGGYAKRTKENVVNSGGTLILSENINSPGTEFTKKCCKEFSRSYLLINPFDRKGEYFVISSILTFLNQHQPEVLNIAGNRESVSPGISKKVLSILNHCFKKL